MKKGTITARTSTGSQAYTGVGFEPGLIFFWGVCQTAEGAGTGAGSFFGVACNNGGTIQQWTLSAGGDHNAGTSNEASYTNSANAISIRPTGVSTSSGLVGQAAVTSFDSDGFTLNWGDAAGSAWIIHYLAIPASVLLNVAAGVTNSASATGDQDFTGPGFQPTGLCVTNHQGNTGVRTGGGLNIGFCDGLLNQFALGWNAVDASAAASIGGAFDDANIVAAPSSTGAWNWRGAVTSMLANGFRINWSTAAAARPQAWVAWAGPETRVGTETCKTGTTGNKDTTGLTGITPQAVLLTGNARASGVSYPDVSSADLWQWAMGGFTASDEGSSWMGNDDGADPTVLRQATSTSKALIERDFSGTEVVAADGSLLSTGFRLAYTTVKASQADEFGYVVFGSVPSATSRLKRWNGSSWVSTPIKHGSGWPEVVIEPA